MTPSIWLLILVTHGGGLSTTELPTENICRDALSQVLYAKPWADEQKLEAEIAINDAKHMADAIAHPGKHYFTAEGDTVCSKQGTCSYGVSILSVYGMQQAAGMIDRDRSRCVEVKQ